VPLGMFVSFSDNVTVILPAKYFDGITRLRGCGFYERG
jgi:hypothetical protein